MARVEGSIAAAQQRISLCVSSGLLASWMLATPVLAQRPGSFQEEARVERVVVDAYVTDKHGDPIPDLTVADFRLSIDGEIVSLESAEWIPADRPEAAPLLWSATEGETGMAPEISPGRLLIFFFQTDLFEPSRIVGLLRMAIQARQWIEQMLLPTDRMAILSFDSHLKLRQDFTSDRGKLLAALREAILAGPSRKPDPDARPSLARHFDFRAARRAITPENALAIISRAAAPIVGAKSLMFFGWGLQTIGGASGPNVKDTEDYREALPALLAARISIFTLDVTDADFHSLEGTLENISNITGGTYQKTHLFANLALDRVRRAIAGRYVLVFRKPDGPRGGHRIDVALATRKGRVLARAAYQD